jgi:hypothetical protein
MGTRAVAIALFLLLPFAVFAQEEPVAILEYFSNQQQITITDSDGFEYNFYIGMDLVPGDTISTDNANAEIRLDPNGTIVKIAPNTEFTIESIQGRSQQNSNSFSMAFGKVRTVAAEVSGARYEVRTPGAVGGVRGTDFGVEYREGSRNGLAVLDGEVEFTNLETGESITLNSGEYADTFAESFQATQLSQEQLQEAFSDLQFEELSPDAVQAQQQEETEQEAEEQEDTGQPDTGAAATQQDQPTEDGEEGDGEQAQQDGPMQEAFAAVADYLAMEIGSVTIDGVTYSKLVLQPEFSAGKFRTQLYLPFIYQNDLFNPNDWHEPKGNNEWSFGTDQDWEDEPLEAVGDVATDLALKFRYLQYGEQRDPFFVKLGNLDTMTLGHGILMNDYANDVDFPAVRRLGINTGVDLGGAGFEAVVNDMVEPEIFGTRLYVRPFADTVPLAFGVSAVSDIDPAGDLPREDVDGNPVFEDTRNADPIFLNVAFDVDMPIVERDLLSMIAFSDIGGMMPYLREEISLPGGGTLDAGLRDEVLYNQDTNTLKNYGTMTGVFGNIFILDYRLDFRTYKGTFRPFFYDGSYERLRGQRAEETVDYLRNPDAPRFDNSQMGVYGSAGFSLFNEQLSLNAGYLWPWEIDQDGQLAYSEDDLFEIELDLAEGLLPFGLRGGITYKRTHFIPTLINEGDYKDAELFDENTRFAGEVVYPIAPSLDLALQVTTTVVRNSDGTVRYEDGSPVYGPSINIETRLGF